MKISIRPLNKGEIFCCSIHKAKERFKNTPIHLNFAYYGRDCSVLERGYEADYWKRNIRGRIIARMCIDTLNTSPLLSFYPVKEITFSNELKKDFEDKYLSVFYDMFISSSTNKDLISKPQTIIAELIDNKIKIHKIILKH